MRLFSTRQSSRAGEPSVLSVLESLLALSASIWIIVHFGTWTYFLFGAAIAPFTLLRTDASCVDAIVLFDRFNKRLLDPPMPRSIQALLEWLDVEMDSQWRVLIVGPLLTCFFAYYSISYLVASIIARIWAIARSFVSSPFTQLCAIPGNWARVIFSTDLLLSPELVPLPVDSETLKGVHTWHFYVEELEVYTLVRNRWRQLRAAHAGAVANALLKIWSVWFLFTIFVTACAYRFSVKSTALFWFPLLWAAKPSKRNDRTWEKEIAVQYDQKAPQLVPKQASSFRRCAA